MALKVLHGFGNLVIWFWKGFGKALEILLKEFVRTLIIVEIAYPMIFVSILF